MPSHSILCVDDEVDNVDALERLFRRKYQVFKATSGKEALKILEQENISLIISDQRMPQMTGVEFLKKSVKTNPNAIRILLTGYTDIESVIDAINSGEVYRYLTKPWDPVDLTNTIDKAIEKFELRSMLEQRNRELQAALEELKTLDSAKNQFMVLVNHELKTPLTVILSFLDLLRETDLSPDQAKFVSRISESSRRLHQIVLDVLELVSAETGVLKLNRKKIEAKQLLKEIDPELIRAAEAKGQSIKFEIGNLEFKADPKVIHSVLQRLVDNAVKFGSKSSDITISTQKKDKDHGIVSVTNDGKALSEKIIENIMRPFTLDEDVMHHSKGLGLGLSLSRALLKCHDSQLQFESHKGQVTVSFELPLS